MRYFDSGVLVKLYHLEPNSAVAAACVHEVAAPIPLNPLHRLELHSALRLMLGRGEIAPADCQQALVTFAQDCAAGSFPDEMPDWKRVFDRAEQLSAAHTATTLSRSLDILHVALALESGATEFCTFDQRQATMARLVGLTVVP